MSSRANALPNGISVIVPVLNERECLPDCVEALRRCDWAREIIIVDGGSGDGSREWLARQPGIRTVEVRGGRGAQLNAGARIATGDVLLFLHCDCRLPQHAGVLVQRALRNSAVGGGAFSVRFAEERPRRLRIVAHGINLRARITRTATGEQGIFVRRSVFRRVAGFPEWPLFEDVEIVRRIKRHYGFVLVPATVTVSARRHVQCGVLRTVLLVYLLRLAYWVGLSPATLKGWFRDARSGGGGGGNRGLTRHPRLASQLSPSAVVPVKQSSR